MKHIMTISILLIALAASCGLISCDSGKGAGEHTSAGEDHAGHDDHDEQGDNESEAQHSDVVVLTDAQLQEHGVEFAPLAAGAIVTRLTLPAEVGFNQDALLHITPRAPGIVEDVFGFLGDDVKAGQTLAVMQSLELGEAKIALLQILESETIAQADLQRQQTISGNTERLLEIMRSDPSLDELQSQSSRLRIGANKGRLVSAYARLKASDANHTMEQDLRSKSLSTEAELLAAKEAFNSAFAEYMSIFEEIDFSFRVDLQQAQRAAHTAASSALNAKRRLHLLGLTDAQIESVADEPPSDIARYEIRSPGRGRIVSKHIAPGEKIGGDDPVYTVASLDTVWLNIAVYERYLDQIRKGQSVVVHVGERDAAGRVVYVSAMLSEGTRTVTARVVLENKDRSWKPGEFVTVGIETGHVRVARLAPIESIQEWEGRDVIFVRDADGIEPRAIRLGLRDDEYVEILGDEIPLGSMVVVKNSFLMKAELGKGAAGHDH